MQQRTRPSGRHLGLSERYTDRLLLGTALASVVVAATTLVASPAAAAGVAAAGPAAVPAHHAHPHSPKVSSTIYQPTGWNGQPGLPAEFEFAPGATTDKLTRYR